MKKFILATLVALLTVGCGESKVKEEPVNSVKESTPKEKRAPDCGSNDVKNAVIDVLKIQREKEIQHESEGIKRKIDGKVGMKKVFQDLINSGLAGVKTRKDIEKINQEIAVLQEELKTFLAKKEKETTEFTLKRILTESVDDRAQKSICKATVHRTIEGKLKTWEIDYTAQYTSDGEMIVNVK